MPQFQSYSPAKRFLLGGLCLNRAIDAVPDGKYPWLLNVRANEEGQIVGRQGLTRVAQVNSGAGHYIHSGITYGQYNPNASGGSARFLGFDTSLLMGLSPPNNPDSFSTTVDTAFSGNPMALWEAAPFGNSVPWLYVYDSSKQRRYSTSVESTGVPIPKLIGLPQPRNGVIDPTIDGAWLRPTGITKAAGGLTGNYYYLFRLRDSLTGTIGIPGPATYTTVNLVSQQATITAPNTFGNPILADIFRFGGTVNDWRLVGTVPSDGLSTFVDNVPDSQLNAALTLDQTRYMPWLQQGVNSSYTVNTAAAVAGTGVGDGSGSIITFTAGSLSNGWRFLPGTQLLVNKSQVATLIRYISSTSVEVQENLGAITGATLDIIGPTMMSQPLPYVWGPYGSGTGGVFYFAVGDQTRPGWLQWTNGNDIDSTNVTNSLQITDPSEPLQNGCIYQGNCYVWSSERMWQVYPDLTRPGQFIAQVIAGGKGLWMNWAFAVGDYIYWLAKDGIYRFAGGLPECITDMDLFQLFPHDALGGQTVTLPNPENFAAPITINPIEPNPNFTKAGRMSWGDGELRFHYQESGTGNNRTLIWAKLPSQDGATRMGWLNDTYGPTPGGLTMSFWEKGTTLGPTQLPVHSLLIAINGTLYQNLGVTDDTVPVVSQVMTRADNLGDSRALNYIGDVVVLLTGGASNSITVRVLGDYNTSQLATTACTGTTEQTYIIDMTGTAAGGGALNRTVGFWLNWSNVTSGAVLSEFSPYWVPKPETIQKRATDWTDDGTPGSKWLKALVIESDVSVLVTANDLVVNGANPLQVTSATHGFVASDVGSVIQVIGGAGFLLDFFVIQSINGTAAILDHSPAAVGTIGGSYLLSGSRTVQLQTDGGAVAATFTLRGPGQTEFPYAVPLPVICREMRLVPTDSSTCRIFQVRYIWDAYPEYLPIIEDYTLDQFPGNKYVRGVVLEGDTQGTKTNFNLVFDGGTVQSIPNITQNGKTLTVVAFSTPFIASECRIVPLGSWRRFSVRYIFDGYPDLGAIITSWSQEGAAGRTRNIRGGILHVDSGNIAITAQLQGDGGVNLGAPVAFTAKGQTEIAFAFPVPLLSHLTRWVPSAGWRYWETIWDQDIYPELIPELSPIFEVNGGDAAFIQGFKLMVAGGGQTARIQILYDGGQLGPLLTTPVINDRQMVIFPAGEQFTPFIAHSIQYQPLDPVRGFWEESKVVFEPVPELATIWQTQETDLDFPGYHYHRDAWIAYQSAPLAVFNETLAVITQFGTQNYTLPLSTTFTRVYLPLLPQKARYRTFKVTSTLGVRLFVKDCAIRCRGWGDQGPLVIKQPFGDLSRANGARI